MASASELQKAVEALANKEPGWKPFTRPAPQGNKPAVVGKGVPGGGASRTGTALIEQDYTLREFYAVTAASTFITSDGAFTFEVPPLKKLILENGIPFELKEPV